LSGTVPIHYSGVQYNIPVEFFIPTLYPAEAPRVFVRPTSNMTVKPGHKHVTPNGAVSLPYLREWTSGSNLVGMIETCSAVFSIEPPLFAKP
ncbi:ubiquitin E2 variant, partial [Ochromonadaceae sp. CCMP2298]